MACNENRPGKGGQNNGVMAMESKARINMRATWRAAGRLSAMVRRRITVINVVNCTRGAFGSARGGGASVRSVWRAILWRIAGASRQCAGINVGCGRRGFSLLSRASRHRAFTRGRGTAHLAHLWRYFCQYIFRHRTCGFYRSKPCAKRKALSARLWL